VGTELVRLKYSHEAMVDQIISNPSITTRELAVRFGVTENWLYRIRASSMFRERLLERTKEMVDPVLAASIEERFDMMVNRSLEVLMDKMSKPSEEVSDDLALAAAQLGAKARGYGGFGAKQTSVVLPPDPGRLDQLANRLRNLNQGVYDVDAREVPPAGQSGSGGEASD
jgi:hypothetical protein